MTVNNPIFQTQREPDEEMTIDDKIVRDVLNNAGWNVPEDAGGGETELPDDQKVIPEEILAPAPDESIEPEPDPAPPTPPGGPVFREGPLDIEDESGEVGDETPPAVPSPPAPSFTSLPDGRQVTPAQIQAWAELDARINSDPNLREGLSSLLNPRPAPPPQQSTLPPLPNISEEDLADNPALQAMVIIAARQQQETAALRQQIEAQQAQQQQVQFKEAQETTNAAVTSFQRTYNIPDAVMAEVRNAAGRNMEPMYTYMRGIDPRTGKSVVPDQFKAIEVTLEMAYWNTPSSRQFEIERQAQHRAATTTRKQKLAGIGGSSGSTSRTPKPPDLTDEDARHRAAVEFAAAAMNGESDLDV